MRSFTTRTLPPLALYIDGTAQRPLERKDVDLLTVNDQDSVVKKGGCACRENFGSLFFQSGAFRDSVGVFACMLGLVQGQIRALHQRVRVLAMGGVDADAYAGGYAGWMAIQDIGLRHRLDHF